jgi:Mce-associated membrane protein
MDRPRNRRRIAGQRRTSTGTTAAPPATEIDETPTELDEAPTEVAADETTAVAPAEVTTKASAERVQDVTPATSEPSKDLDEDPATPSETTDSDEKRRSLGGVLSALLGVVVVLVLVVTVLLGVKAWQGKQAEDARDQAAAAGRKAAETILSYDYRNLDKNFAASEAVMTPDYAGKFAETAKVVRVLAAQQKTTVRADVREVGVRDGDADRVTLIIFVNQTTTNSETTKSGPRVDLNRTRFTMVRNGDQWLVQDIAGL